MLRCIVEMVESEFSGDVDTTIFHAVPTMGVHQGD